jgi:hypothetical protein
MSTKVWACSNQLLGKCQEYDYKDLEKTKKKYWMNKEDCHCDLPRDLSSLIFSNIDKKTRSNLRQLSTSPLVFEETKTEKRERELFNELMKTCDSEKIKTLPNKDLLNDREFLLLLLLSSVKRNCLELFQQLMSIPSKLSENDLFEILKELINNQKDIRYLNQFLFLPNKEILTKFFETNPSFFDKFIRDNDTPISYIVKRIIQSPILLHRLLINEQKTKWIIDASDLLISLIKENYKNLAYLTEQNSSKERINREISELMKDAEQYEQDLKLFLKFNPSVLDEENTWPSFPNYPSLGDYQFIVEEEEEEEEDD